MTVQDQKQRKYSTHLVFRLQDASSGGCYVSINGDSTTTTITVDSTQHTKCSLGHTHYSSASWLLDAEMRMD